MEAQEGADPQPPGCPICISPIEPKDRSVLDLCMHEFCFPCIRRWTLAQMAQGLGTLPEKPVVCPLCKCKYSSIFHAIIDDMQYKSFTVGTDAMMHRQQVFQNAKFASWDNPSSRSPSTFHELLEQWLPPPPSLTNASKPESTPINASEIAFHSNQLAALQLNGAGARNPSEPSFSPGQSDKKNCESPIFLSTSWAAEAWRTAMRARRRATPATELEPSSSRRSFSRYNHIMAQRVASLQKQVGVPEVKTQRTSKSMLKKGTVCRTQKGPGQETGWACLQNIPDPMLTMQSGSKSAPARKQHSGHGTGRQHPSIVATSGKREAAPTAGGQDRQRRRRHLELSEKEKAARIKALASIRASKKRRLQQRV